MSLQCSTNNSASHFYGLFTLSNIFSYTLTLHCVMYLHASLTIPFMAHPHHLPLLQHCVFIVAVFIFFQVKKVHLYIQQSLACNGIKVLAGKRASCKLVCMNDYNKLGYTCGIGGVSSTQRWRFYYYDHDDFYGHWTWTSRDGRRNRSECECYCCSLKYTYILNMCWWKIRWWVEDDDDDWCVAQTNAKK